MAVVYGACLAHAPTVFTPVEHWSELHRVLAHDVPQPAALVREDAEHLAAARVRLDDALAELTRGLREARPDLVVVVGDDQDEVFGAHNQPNLAIFTGAAAAGSTSFSLLGQDPTDNVVTLPGSPEIAGRVVEHLLARAFTPATVAEIRAEGRRKVGLGHAFVRPFRWLGMAELGVPVLPVFLNAYHPPMLDGVTCHQLGLELYEVLDALSERVAIVGSGGLSHDPLGPLAGWIDSGLDEWVLGELAAGRAHRLARLFGHDATFYLGGTGEIRCWIVASAGFDGRPATVIDYLPLIHSVTGLGFVHWPVAAA
ncbi:MAG TPA: hypothetical protein VNQ73_04095 [Ilumatobacter sp.]|nr:hypothetical protein [Ilumatobacter sp.]